MQVNRNSIIAGHRAVTVKKLVEKISEPIDVKTAADILQWKDQNRTAQFLEELVRLDYLTANERLYGLTKNGKALSRARLVNYMTRDVADLVIRKAKETAEIVNEIATFCWISKMHVQGTYLTDALDIDHLEITITIEPREHHPSADAHLNDIIRVFERLHDRLHISCVLFADMPTENATLIFDVDDQDEPI